MGKGGRSSDPKSKKVREMRNADTILGVIRGRGKRGLPLEDIYRQLYNPSLYLLAYARLYANKGAMTRGVTSETVDAMSLGKIEHLIDALRHERYRWTPVRRTYVPKKTGKLRPLGIPPWSDKLLQEVIRLILDAYYDPQFSPYSHGFRPDRGCHTALRDMEHTWTGTKWFIEGDIHACFDSLDHQVLVAILQEKLHDNRFIRLIQGLLAAGYLEDWRHHPTLSGCPQGGVCSPILSNIYLDRLDTFVTDVLLPAYTRGEERQRSAQYNTLRVREQYYRKRGNRARAEALHKQRQRIPERDPLASHYRRLRYVRYADDFCLGFAGPKAEAEEIKLRLKTFLREQLTLELSEEKTLITHASTQAAQFLGYELVVQYCDSKRDHTGRRCINGHLSLRVPARVIEQKCMLYMRKGTPQHRMALVGDTDFSIVARYQSEYRGVVQYYLLAQNVYWLWKLHWVMRTSLLKTLAHKHQCSVAKMAQRYHTLVATPHGLMTCLQITVPRDGKPPLVARFGGISLHRQPLAVLTDLLLTNKRKPARSELLKRLLANMCEVCGSAEQVEVQHIRKLADRNKPGQAAKPWWVRMMAARRRKTLVVCRECHHDIHAVRPRRQPLGA
jgi:group II intron reverse transcriptase/maturase